VTAIAQDVDALARLEARDAAGADADDADDVVSETSALPPALDAPPPPSAAIVAAQRARASGVVVGIVRRAWKPLSGALLPALSVHGGSLCRSNCCDRAHEQALRRRQLCSCRATRRCRACVCTRGSTQRC
jgi:hypothetical protein